MIPYLFYNVQHVNIFYSETGLESKKVNPLCIVTCLSECKFFQHRDRDISWHFAAVRNRYLTNCTLSVDALLFGILKFTLARKKLVFISREEIYLSHWPSLKLEQRILQKYKNQIKLFTYFHISVIIWRCVKVHWWIFFVLNIWWNHKFVKMRHTFLYIGISFLKWPNDKKS